MLELNVTTTQKFHIEERRKCLDEAFDLVARGQEVTVIDNETGEVIFNGHHGLVNAISASDLAQLLNKAYNEGYAEGYNDGVDET